MPAVHERQRHTAIAPGREGNSRSAGGRLPSAYAPSFDPVSRTPSTGAFSCPRYAISGMINSATMLATLIIGLMAGPAVSLNGSPTVSPVTDAA